MDCLASLSLMRFRELNMRSVNGHISIIKIPLLNFSFLIRDIRECSKRRIVKKLIMKISH